MLVIVPLVSALVAEDDFSADSGVEMIAAASTEVEGGIHLGSLGTLLVLLVGSKGSDSKAYCEACGSKRSERQPVGLERRVLKWYWEARSRFGSSNAACAPHHRGDECVGRETDKIRKPRGQA